MIIEIGKTITKNNRKYTIILDRVVSANIVTDDFANNFVFAKRKLTFTQLLFYADFDSVNVENPVGVWHCIFSKIKFNYSSDFKYKIKNGDEFLFLEYTKNTNELKTIVSSEYIDINDYKELDISNIVFGDNDFEVIRTDAQKRQIKYKLYKKIILIIVIIFFCASGIMLFIYFSLANKFNNSQKQLTTLIQQENILSNRFNILNSKLVKNNNNIYPHLSRILLLINNNINFSTKLNLAKSKIIIIIESQKLEFMRFLFQVNNYKTKLKSNDLVKQKAVLELEF